MRIVRSVPEFRGSEGSGVRAEPRNPGTPGTSEPTIECSYLALTRPKNRLLRRWHGPAESTRRTQEQSLARTPRGRDDVRQRRIVGAVARRARRAAAGRRAEMRPGARAK